MKLKLRPKTVLRNVTEGDSIKLVSTHAIEVCVNRKWTLLGLDDSGPSFFKTAKERDRTMNSLQGKEIEA